MKTNATLFRAFIYFASFSFVGGVVNGGPAGPSNASSNRPPGTVAMPSVRATTAVQTKVRLPSVVQTNALGVAIATGEPAKREIEVIDGGAKAEFGLQKVYFPADVAEGPVTIIAPDGRKLRCRSTFLAFYDAATDQTVLVSAVTNSVGSVFGDDTVIYPDAFASIAADIRYHYTKFSLEQDIILKANPRLPKGFSTNSTRLEVWTEWIESDPVSTEEQAINLRIGGNASQMDESPNFGAMKIGAGHAFSAQTPQDRIPVAKTWGKSAGRTWLVESVDFESLKPKLKALPLSQAAASESPAVREREELIRSLAQRQSPSPRKTQMALLDRKDYASEVVLDFTIVSSVPVPSGVISWWPAGGNTEDAIANNDGNPINGVGFGPGRVGQGFSFTGYDDGIEDGASLEIPNASALNPTNGLTIEAWVYFDSDASGQNMPIVSKDAPVGRQYLLTKNSNNRLRAHVGITNNVFYYTDGRTALQPETWYHVAMTYSAAESSLRIYVNGTLDTNVVVSGSMKAVNTPVYLGRADASQSVLKV